VFLGQVRHTAHQRCIWIAQEDGEGIRACIEETGMDLCSMRAVLGKGECLLALEPFLVLTSTFSTEHLANVWFPPCLDDKTKTIPLGSISSIRGLPFGSSLSRTVLIDCS